MIKVFVVEDSPVSRQLIVHILEGDPGVKVMGTATNGQEALDFLAHNKPDIITMDIHMPLLDGFETTRRIMETRPVPIVMVSANLQPAELALAFRAMEAGAVGAVEKPRGIGHPDHETMATRLVQTVKALSEVRVVRRWARHPLQGAVKMEAKASSVPLKIVAIGASTGGPPVLQTILSGLDKNFPVPIVIVQHIAAGFSQGLADWLTKSTGFRVTIAQAGETLAAGHAYVAPDGAHLGVNRENRVVLSASPPEHAVRPAVSHLFRSVAGAFGVSATAVLLTGMGRDGAAELKLLKDTGAITFAQDKETSVVHGMPGEAIQLGGATYVLPPERIAAMLNGLAHKGA